MAERNRNRRSAAIRQCHRGIRLVFAGILAPLTFGFIFTSQLLWVWHSVNDFTRQGAGYAATHCWEASAGNVIAFMQANVPLMPDQAAVSERPRADQRSHISRKTPTTGILTRLRLRRRLLPPPAFPTSSPSASPDFSSSSFSLPRPAADRAAQFPGIRSHGERRLRPGASACVNMPAIK